MKKMLLFLIVCLFLIVPTVQAADVTLAWDAVNDSRVIGYKLYYGTASGVYGTPVDVGKVTQFKLTGVKEGVNIFFAVTAYESSTNESAFSTELPCWTLIPTKTGSGTITPAVATVISAINATTFTITPSAGNRIKDVLVDGVSVGKVATYTFPVGTKTSHTFAASFEVIPAIPSVTGLKLVN